MVKGDAERDPRALPKTLCVKIKMLPSYETDHYELDNGEEIHNEYPETFEIPSRALRENLRAGSIVKLIFRMEEKTNQEELSVVRMWVEIKKMVLTTRVY